MSAVSERLRPPRLGPRERDLSPRQVELLDEMERIFVEEGFSSLTVGELSARLRCSRRTLYELAPTKDELVLVVFDRWLRRFGRIAQQRLTEFEDPGDRIEQFLLAGYTELHRAGQGFGEEIARHPAVSRLFTAHYRYATAVLGEVIEDGVAEGLYRPVPSRVVAELAGAALERFQDPDLQRETGMTIEEMAVVLAQFLHAGLEQRPTRARTRRRSA
jgi:AcrR family transcriptional regulator